MGARERRFDARGRVEQLLDGRRRLRRGRLLRLLFGRTAAPDGVVAIVTVVVVVAVDVAFDPVVGQRYGRPYETGPGQRYLKPFRVPSLALDFTCANPYQTLSTRVE